MEYHYGSHTVYKIQYHFVFVTKYDLVTTHCVATQKLTRQRYIRKARTQYHY